MSLGFLPHPRPHRVKQFQEVYLKNFGVELDDVMALEMLTKLSGLVYIKEGPRLRAEWEDQQD